MKNTLTFLYLACFAACGWPSIYRIVRRKSSQDLSVWREWLLIVGVCAQFAVMRMDGASINVWISPLNTALSVGLTLVAIYYYRH